jgi:hypothetical protein
LLRRILSRKGLHKLSLMWEGPFKVAHIYRPGSERRKLLKVYQWDTRGTSPLRKFYPWAPHEESKIAILAFCINLRHFSAQRLS